MNKRIIVLIALVVAVFALPASAASANDEVTSVNTVEVRGTIAEFGPGNATIATSVGAPLYVADYDEEAWNGNQPGFQWDYSTFPGFWYDPDDDLGTETMTILATERYAPHGDTLSYPDDREIGEGSLIYTTHPVFREYQMHQDIPDPSRTTQTKMEGDWDGDGIGDRGVNGNYLPNGVHGPDLLDQDIGLCVESDNAGGDCGYFLEGWMGEKYVAIDDKADRLCKLLVEFEDDDKKTLATGEEWDMGSGYSLAVKQIGLEGDKVWFLLNKDGREIDNEVATIGVIDRPQYRVYTYTADIGDEENIPVFSCYVNAISGETDTVEIMYVFLIDNDVLEIECSDIYGAMEVMTASIMQIVLNNDETAIDLDIDTTEHIMGNMYFQTADDDINNNIRFCPYVEYTEPGTYEVRGTIAEFDPVNPTIAASVLTPLYVTDVYADGTNVPGFQWDYSSFAGFWYDLDDDLQTEHLTILATPPAGAAPLEYPIRREIAEGGLVYTTHPVFQEYELHQDIEPSPARVQTAMEACYDAFFERGIGTTGLCVESNNLCGDCGYFIEGWMAEEYVAIDGNADKLCKLLVEFRDDDTETLYVGDEWNLSGGFTLELIGVDDTGKKATLQLSKNGVPLEGGPKCIDTGGMAQERVYTYTPDIGGKQNIPVFSCYLDSVFKGSTSYVQLMYVFLIDDDVLEIDTSDTYGAMEVMTASSMAVVLNNDETTIDLDIDNTEHIMGGMYFKTADDDNAIRFYPFVERTIGGEEPTPQPGTCNITDTDHDGVPDVWDADNSTPAGYYVNSNGIGRKWGDMNGDGELTSVDALIILQAAVGGASAQSIAIKAEDGGSLPDSILVGETFTVLITDDGSPVGTGTIVIFTLPQDTGDPVLVQTDGSGKVNYMPLNIGTLGIRVLDGTVTVAEATVEVI